MKKILALILSLLCVFGLASCGSGNEEPAFETKIPEKIAFSFAFDAFGYESEDIYLCQIIGNSLFVYEQLGTENAYGRFFECKDGACKFYFRNYNGTAGWTLTNEYDDYHVTDIKSAIFVFNGVSYALNVGALQGAELRGSGEVCGIECDLYGIGDQAYWYDAKDHLILQNIVGESFHYEVVEFTTDFGGFADSPAQPSEGVNIRAVFGK